MADEKVIELGAHAPTVASVMSRLNRYEAEIDHISVIVSWKEDGDGAETAAFGDCMPLKELCCHKVIFEQHVRRQIDDD